LLDRDKAEVPSQEKSNGKEIEEKERDISYILI